MFDPAKHSRRTVRLQGYDYSGIGCYFITLCASCRRPVFGQIENGAMRLNRHGALVRAAWLQTPSVRPAVVLDEWIIMPDHFHALLFVTDRLEPAPLPASLGLFRPPRSLGALVAGFKSAASSAVKGWREEKKYPAVQLWQRNYYDHIVRNERELERIRHYIRENPSRVREDDHFC